MGSIHKLVSVSRALAYWSGVAGGERRQNASAVILIFHGTPRYRAAELERQLRYVKRHFDVVPLHDLVARLGAPSKEGMARAALTFDDGLRNNVTVTYPVLRKLALPATFFLCPGLIERRKWLWTHEARQRLRYAGEGLRRELAAQFGVSARGEDFMDWMKRLDLVSRRCVEASLREATPHFVPSAAERDEFDLASWNELRELDPALVTLASHTMHHPVLTCLTDEEVEAEVGESRRLLEARLRRPIDLFAYPNGDFNRRVCDVVRRHYRAAFAGIGTWLRPGCDPFLLPRIIAPVGALRLVLSLHREPAAHPRRHAAAPVGAPV